MERLYEPLKLEDLKALQELALKEHEAFFKRNSHLKEAYGNALIGIVLAQGAASHYLDPTVGIKDFDIWHFYLKDENHRFPDRAHKRVENGYKGRPIDFLKRAIPRRIYEKYSGAPGQAIIGYLREGKTKSGPLLLQKAVIGLYPDAIFGKVLWEGEKKET